MWISITNVGLDYDEGMTESSKIISQWNATIDVVIGDSDENNVGTNRVQGGAQSGV